VFMLVVCVCCLLFVLPLQVIHHSTIRACKGSCLLRQLLHTRQICRDLTTNEVINLHKYPYLHTTEDAQRQSTFSNPFDMGPVRRASRYRWRRL
jgi:hypothetical protein